MPLRVENRVGGALAALQLPPYAAETTASDGLGSRRRLWSRRGLRSESLQEVPIAVDAFSSKAIQDAGVRDYSDFVALTPNVSLVEAESVGQSFLTIRGLTEVRNGQAPVAFVVDGVQESSNRQFTQAMFDLDSIQVLKGPQGALYGRNASGGAIVITTKQPTNDYQGYVQARRRLRRHVRGPGRHQRPDSAGSPVVPPGRQLSPTAPATSRTPT